MADDVDVALSEEGDALLETLTELQRVDSAIARLDDERRHGPERLALDEARAGVALLAAKVDQLEGELARVRDRRVAAWEELERQQTRADRLERQARAGAGGIRASEALEHEVATARARQADLEEEALGLMETEERLAAELEHERADREAAEEAAYAAGAVFDRREQELKSEEEALAAERRALADRLPPGLLQRYERLRTRSGGLGVVTVDHGVCSGCQLRLSAAGLEEARPARSATGATEPGVCEHCGRLVVAC